MNAESPIRQDTRPRWGRRAAILMRRGRNARLLEIAAVAALVLMIGLSYAIISGSERAAAPLTPAVVAALLVANLVPAMALMVLLGRRVAMRRARRSPVGGKGRLHVRLVALFSVIASVPMLLVVIFASLLFQFGVEFWSSDQAKGMVDNAAAIARQTYVQELERVNRETVTMASDMARAFEENAIELDDLPAFIETIEFQDYFFRQAYLRNLTEAVLIYVTPGGEIQPIAFVNPTDRDLNSVATPEMVAALREGRASIVIRGSDRISALTRLGTGQSLYLYASRWHDPEMIERIERAQAIVQGYRALIERSRVLQFRFNAALLLVSLLILGATVWIALRLADRLVRPVGELVEAARRVTAGELSARVPASKVHDEVGTLGNAFNRMTRRLEEQTGALVSANEQLESRRAFTEAVLSGVTAGVISVDEDHVVQLINSSAEEILKTGDEAAVGRKLGDLAPELDRQLDAEEREEIIQLASHGEARTLAVKTVKVDGGHVLTFDDITEQLVDQRRAAWADVARRIAHEIKNPLTPIQLAAERLQRRYGQEVKSDAGTFERLTATIVRQVGDLRRMVDEFSSFARMPKPVFRPESVADIVRQSVFLQEVAHPEIRFTLDLPEPSPTLVCDRRLIGQAVTNVVKNAVEAIQQKIEESGAGGEERIATRIEVDEGCLTIEVVDSGIGLPADRRSLTEPYMTTRAKGTGLGLAIVKKVVEEHFGTIEFDDASGGGTRVRLSFDMNALGRLGNDTKIAEEYPVSG